VKVSEMDQRQNQPVIETSREPTSERRVVTILFCDVKGSTNLAEQVDPETWTEVMGGAFRYLVGAVERYDGTIGRLMGDGILAFFGAPLAHEDDPLRAVRSGLDMIQDLRPYQEQARQRLTAAGVQVGVDDFEVRVGINTGLVVVGAVGTQSGSEYTAMGDAVNLAARMEQSAAPGTVLVSHDTYRLVASSVEAEPLGEVPVKGKREPVRVYRVTTIAQISDHGRGLVSSTAVLTGRDREMTQLSWALADLVTGNGGMVCLMGEAGIGKSRLVAELKADGRAGDCRWLEASSLSFEQGQPYGLVRRLLRNMAGAAAGESFQVLREKMEPLQVALDEQQQNEIDQVIQALFGAPGEGSQTAIDGESLQSMLTGALVSLSKTYASGKPLLVVLEDLHWTDSASIETIGRLLPLSQELPLMLLCVFRPHQQAPVWELKLKAQNELGARYTGLTLRPLSQDQSRALASSLVEKAELPEAFHRLVLDKSEGNPFFIEEIVRELIESGALALDAAGKWQFAGDSDHLAVPETLESLLVARLDRLGEATRRTLQIASVIGRSFYFRVLALVSEAQQQLEQQLNQLLSADLVHVAAQAPELEYMFRHALTQEAAYNTILLKDRRRYHRRIGEVLVSIFEESLEEQAPLVARHFALAGDQEQALAYYSLAAGSASRLYSNQEALLHYHRALEAARQVVGGDDRKADLLLGRGQIYERIGEFDKALADFEAAQVEAQATDQLEQVWQALLELGKLWASRDYDKTGFYFREALDVARTIDQPAALAESLNRIGNWYLNQGKPGQAVKYHQEALSIFEGEQDREGLAATHDLLGMNYLIAGDIRKADTHYRRAIEYFREADDYRGIVASQSVLIQTPGSYLLSTQVPIGELKDPELTGGDTLELARKIEWQAGEAFVLEVFASQYCLIGRFDKALQAAEESLRLALEIDHLQWMAGAYLSIGVIYLAMLAPEKALPYFEDGLELGRRTRSHFWLYNHSAYLAQANIDLENYDEAAACLEQILEHEIHLDTVGERLSWLSRANLALAQADASRGLRIINELIETSANMAEGTVISLLWLARGQALTSLGQRAEAKSTLREGLAHTLERGERALTWRFNAGLAQLYQLEGRDTEANEQQELGTAMINELAGFIPEVDLREQYVERAGGEFEPRQ